MVSFSEPKYLPVLVLNQSLHNHDGIHVQYFKQGIVTSHGRIVDGMPRWMGFFFPPPVAPRTSEQLQVARRAEKGLAKSSSGIQADPRAAPGTGVELPPVRQSVSGVFMVLGGSRTCPPLFQVFFCLDS